MVTHSGGCHCGRVRFEVIAPAYIEVTDCNCSMCTRRVTCDLFCSVCGIKSFYVPRSHPDGYSVNARCLDAGTVQGMKVKQMDGVNWEQSHPFTGVGLKPDLQRDLQP